MSKIAICDDVSVQLDILEEAIRECGLFNEEELDIQRFEKGEDLIKVVRKNGDYDFIFLDIHMPGKSGLEIYEDLEITANMKVIFVSTDAKKIPDVHGFITPIFLYKPYNAETLRSTVEALLVRQKNEHKFTYKEGDKNYEISSKEIRYIEVRGHEAMAVADKLIKLGRESLTSLSEKLESIGFFRCHQSFLINLRYYESHGKKDIYLKGNNGTITIPFSRNRKHQLAGAVLRYEMAGDSL